MSDEHFKEVIDKLQSILSAIIIFMIIVVIFGLAALTAHSQELPDHPKPSIVKRAITYTTSNDHYLLAMDGTLRTMDAKSTHDLLSNSCHCFKEDDPIAPHTGNYAAQALFQGGMMALVTFGHYELAKHNHPRWARALVLGDIASESYAVGHNMSLATPKPLPAVPVVAPVTPLKGAFQ
jgi:hypothetical protein